MPRIKKKIVSQGVYDVPDQTKTGIDPATGLPWMRQETVTPNRIRHWAKEGNRYLKTVPDGVPAPWSHIDPATNLPVVLSQNGTLPRSDINGGWWKEFTTEEDPDLGLTLVGILDVEGDENDPNTPAGKVGKTVKETSIFAAPKWKAGNNIFEDVPLHVALVTHPIQPNQPNFEKVEGFTAIAMSNMSHKLIMAATPPPAAQSNTNQTSGASDDNKPGGMSGQNANSSGDATSNAAGADIGQVVQALRQCGIDLPDDTNPQNIFERLLVAARQKAASEGTAGGDLYTAPGGAETKNPAPVAMSSTPAAPKFDFSQVDQATFMSHPLVKQLVDTNNELMNRVLETSKGNYVQRINKLIAEGRGGVTQKYADELLKPLLEGVTMSNCGKSPLDAVLVALEKAELPLAAQQRHANSVNPSMLLGLAMSHGPAGETLDNPFMGTGAVDAAGNPLDSNAIVDDFFKKTGGV